MKKIIVTALIMFMIVCIAGIGTAVGESLKPGDVNEDGVIDIRDFLRLAKYVAGYEVTINKANSNVNGDEVIDIRDFLRLAKYVAGYDVKLESAPSAPATDKIELSVYFGRNTKDQEFQKLFKKHSLAGTDSAVRSYISNNASFTVWSSHDGEDWTITGAHIAYFDAKQENAKKYSICGVYLEMDCSQAENMLLRNGWKIVKKYYHTFDSGFGMDLVKNENGYKMYLETLNGKTFSTIKVNDARLEKEFGGF